MSATGASSRAVAAAQAAIARIQSETDQVEAVRAAARLYDGLRDVADEAADIRRRLIVAIVDSGAMTRRALAAEIGLSERRVGELYQEAVKRQR